MSMTSEYVRRSDGRLERLCEHGIGHPTHKSARRVADKYGHDVEVWLTHGCDGCCNGVEGVGVFD